MVYIISILKVRKLSLRKLSDKVENGGVLEGNKEHYLVCFQNLFTSTMPRCLRCDRKDDSEMRRLGDAVSFFGLFGGFCLCFVLIGWRQGTGSLWDTEGEKVDNGVQLTQNTIGKEIYSSQERITLHSIVIFSFKAERKR